MNTNVLLIIIIILLALGLLVQFIQLVLIFLLPEQVLRLFLDPTNGLLDYDEDIEEDDFIDVDVNEQSQKTKPQGFSSSKKTKFSKRKSGSKINKTSTEASL